VTPLPPPPLTPLETLLSSAAALSGQGGAVPSGNGTVQTPQAPAQNARLLELDGLIETKKGELQRKEASFKEYQAQVEKNLLDLESRRSEMLLGRIYTAVREVARESGVSVIVDKTQILFGHNTVDLTEKVLKKLEETRP
jgi:Skp family chaperone for outer membrane proteins